MQVCSWHMPLRHGVFQRAGNLAHVCMQLISEKCCDYTSKCNMDLLGVIGAHCLQRIADLT